VRVFSVYFNKVEQACCQATLRAKRQMHAACNRLRKAIKKKALSVLQSSFPHNGLSKSACLWTLCRRHFRNFLRDGIHYNIDDKLNL
jgi:hypothetical protein